MKKLLPELTGQVNNHLDPMKTVSAVRSRNVPPLICLACANSGESGVCNESGADIALVRTRWDQQITISQTDFHETLKPNTPLVEICEHHKGATN